MTTQIGAIKAALFLFLGTDTHTHTAFNDENLKDELTERSKGYFTYDEHDYKDHFSDRSTFLFALRTASYVEKMTTFTFISQTLSNRSQ